MSDCKFADPITRTKRTSSCSLKPCLTALSSIGSGDNSNLLSLSSLSRESWP